MTEPNVLIEDAVGFDAKHGDSVNVASNQFSGMLPVSKGNLPPWKQPDMTQHAIQVTEYLALTIGFLILVFTVIRPAICSMDEKDVSATPTFVDCEGEDPNTLIITGAAASTEPGLGGPVTDADSEELPDTLS